MSSKIPMKANLAVSLDQPIIPFSTKSKSFFWRGFLTILISDTFKTAAVAFLIAFTLSLLIPSFTKSTSIREEEEEEDEDEHSAIHNDARRNILRSWMGNMKRCMINLKSNILGGLGVVGRPSSQNVNNNGIPITFDDDNNIDGEIGWAVATLVAKKRVGDSSYVQYDFQLPLKENTLPLSLGQQLNLCCLNDDEEVTRGSFHLFSRRDQKGIFSILAPRTDGEYDRALFELGPQNANFAKVLDCELNVGDEIAIKPGLNNFQYHGRHLPVTGMVCITSGMGIVPILQQIKEVLPNGSSSVEMLTVYWVNENEDDFDIAVKQLENEYNEHNLKLNVYCEPDDLEFSNSFSLNSDSNSNEYIPNYRPGTMAIISGPQEFFAKAKTYLADRKDFPEDCLCYLG